MGPGPIPLSKIDAWIDKRPRPEWERELIRYCLKELDHAYLKWVAEEMKADQKGKRRRVVRDEEMTPELFDRLF